MIKQNTTKYINRSIDTSKYLTTKNIFLQEIFLLNMTETYWGVCSEKKPSEIPGNILIDLERLGKIWKFKKSDENNLVKQRVFIS